MSLLRQGLLRVAGGGGGGVTFALFDPLLTPGTFSISGSGRLITVDSAVFATAYLDQQPSSGLWALEITLFVGVNLSFVGGSSAPLITDQLRFAPDGQAWTPSTGAYIDVVGGGGFGTTPAVIGVPYLLVLDMDTNNIGSVNVAGTTLVFGPRPKPASGYIGVTLVLVGRSALINTGQEAFSVANEIALAQYETDTGKTISRGVFI